MSKKPSVLDRRLKLEYRPVASLTPYAKNARQHPPEQIAKLVKIIERVGFAVPILVDGKNGILKGHGGLQAARQLGMRNVPVIELAGLSAADKRAYILADNRIAQDSGWDEELLRAEMADLAGMGYDMSLTAFDAGEISLTLEPTPGQPTEPPDATLQGAAVSRLGDLWQLGEHRLVCGDATKAEAYQALLDGRLVQCVFTDPPYGVSYQDPNGKFAEIRGDNLRRGQLKAMLAGAFGQALEHTAEDAGWYVWHASGTRDDFSAALRDTGLVEQGLIVWVKPGLKLGWCDYQWAHEPCFYAARQGVRPAFYGPRSETTVWRVDTRSAKGGTATALGSGVIITGPGGEEIYVAPSPPKGRKIRHVEVEAGKPALVTTTTEASDVWEVGRDNGHGKGNAIHPTQKPVELARRALRNSTREGEAALDMFAGSGSLIMAAEQTGRVGYSIELEPRYVDAIVRRWQELTGKDATHANEKKTFAAIAKARAGSAGKDPAASPRRKGAKATAG